MSCPPEDVAGKTKQQYEKTEQDQGRKGRTGKPKHNKNIFGAAAAVCGRGSIVNRGSTYYAVVLVPCYTMSAISFLLCQPRFLFDRYLSPSLFPWMPPITGLRRAPYRTKFRLIVRNTSDRKLSKEIINAHVTDTIEEKTEWETRKDRNQTQGVKK